MKRKTNCTIPLGGTQQSNNEQLRFFLLFLLVFVLAFTVFPVEAKKAKKAPVTTVIEVVELPLAPVSLSKVPVPSVPGLENFIGKKTALLRLGKSLFWDQAAGSDGQACASCHFHAGADNRVKNQLTPGLLRASGPDKTFQPTASGGAGGPNYTLVKDDFPFHQFNNPNDRNSGVKFTTNDITSSQGTFGGNFIAVPGINELKDDCDRFPDPVFHVSGVGVRKVEPRHTPTVINAVFNFRNFWDGRANNVFNGVDPFGLRNGQARIFKKDGSTQKVDLRNSALASQAVGPPESDFEMICTGRKIAAMGKKLIPRRALALQKVHKDNDKIGGKKRHSSGFGLKETYRELIQKAFKKEFWEGTGNFGGFTQMEANFSFFWGVALQEYQSVLISDQAPYDKFAGKKTKPFDPSSVGGKERDKLTAAQRDGLNIFLDKGKCINCHKGPEFSGAASVLQAENEEDGLVERMLMGDGGVAMYDNGFYNIGVTPTNEDLGVGGVDPFGNPLSFTLQFVNDDFVDPINVDPCTFEIPFSSSNCSHIPSNLSGQRVAVRGAFKVPTLRNVELTGPYMHNGSMSTLEQVVEFYNRGGNFHNNPELDPDIQPLGLSSTERANLVAFLKALTDPRVANEKKPFDHPQIFVPNGHPGDESSVSSNDGVLANDDLLEVPAVGKDGRSKEGLSALKPFVAGLGSGSGSSGGSGTSNPPPTNPPQIVTINKRISSGNDDAEESSSGFMYLTSSDLELVFDSFENAGNQKIGLRFRGITVPQGATITNAYVQFQTDETDTGTTNLTIHGQATNDATGFTTSTGNISSRTKTGASVSWSPLSWSSVGEAGARQRTPNLIGIIQEIVNRSGWTSGKSMAILISGTGQRVAESYNGSQSRAPLLHIEYEN